MRPIHLAFPFLVLAVLSVPLQAAAHDLSDGASVRIQSSELGPSWHMGTVQITKDGCTMVRKPAPEVSGGHRGLGLMFIQKLERQDGTKWIDMPVAPMVQKEPSSCQEGAG